MNICRKCELWEYFDSVDLWCAEMHTFESNRKYIVDFSAKLTGMNVFEIINFMLSSKDWNFLIFWMITIGFVVWSGKSLVLIHCEF